MSTLEPRITGLDESYSHQLVAPRVQTAHLHANWQERCYHLLYAADDLMLDMGRALWPHEGVHRAFLGVSDGSSEHCVRTEVPFAWGDDPDDPDVGGISVQSVRPLREVRLRFGRPGEPLAVDLTYTARFAPVATTPLRVEQEGEVVTEYMNFFQSGYYDGWVQLGDRRHEVVRRAGFRDRGWGVRKHEGAPRRGLVLSAFCEFGDFSVYLILFEAASGRRVLADGWLIEDERYERVETVEHDLVFADDLLQGGSFELRLARGRRLTVAVEPRLRLFLAGVGYSPDAARRAPGHDVFDLEDEAVARGLRGQTDHACVFELDGQSGHGYVETGLGIHARYRPGEEAG